MSKDKHQKIWNEIKITFAKIKEIHSTHQITSTNQYLSLTPIHIIDYHSKLMNQMIISLFHKLWKN